MVLQSTPRLVCHTFSMVTDLQVMLSMAFSSLLITFYEDPNKRVFQQTDGYIVAYTGAVNVDPKYSYKVIIYVH